MSEHAQRNSLRPAPGVAPEPRAHEEDGGRPGGAGGQRTGHTTDHMAGHAVGDTAGHTVGDMTGHVDGHVDTHGGTHGGGHGGGHGEAPTLDAAGERRRLNRLAVSATLHCLTGCAIGEVLGMVIGTSLGWTDMQTIALAVGLAFLFGYSFTIVPVLRAGLAFRAAVGVALAADTLSITVMEVVDNAIMVAIPGAMEAGVASFMFWGSLAVALAVAFVVTVPVNRALLRRGKGHAVVHRYHH